MQPSSGLAQVRLYNVINCKANVDFVDQKFALEALDTYQNLNIPVADKATFNLDLQFSNCAELNDPNLKSMYRFFRSYLL